MRKLSLKSQPFIENSLSRWGFWLGQAPSAAVQSQDWHSLVRASEMLPRDAYANEANRYRTFNRLLLKVFSPDTAELQDECSGTPYIQTKNYNPELGGVARRYPPSAVISEKNLVLQEILSTFATSLCRVAYGAYLGTFRVNVHHVRYLATQASPSRNSPSGLHKDGERFISVHLLTRKDMSGGANKIAGNDHEMLAEFTLERPGQCFLIDDEKVWHSIEEMYVGPGATVGTRNILLIDYLPTSMPSV
jgi:hypothetical protein